MREKTLRSLGATAVLLVIALAAYTQVGSGEPSSLEITTSTDRGATTAVSVAETSLEPEPFVYRVGLLAGLTTDNYWEYLGADPTVWNAYVLGPTKPTLYTIDPATSTPVSELLAQTNDPRRDADGWSVDLEIRDDVNWSDGTPITARDVVFTFGTVRRFDLGGGWADVFPEAVESIAAVSDTEVRIEFKEKPTLAVWPHSVGLAPIMPAHVWSERLESVNDAGALYALSGSSDVSGGPLTLLEAGKTEVTARLNRADRPVTVIYRVYEDEVSAGVDLKKGEIDIILTPGGLSPASVESLSDVEDVTLASSPANAVRYLGFNLSREPMSSQAFRNALGLLLDRERIAAALAPGASAAYTVLAPANTSWFDEEAVTEIVSSFDLPLGQKLDRALDALRADGYAWQQEPTADGGVIEPGTGLTIDGRVPAPLTILTPGDEYDPARPEYAAEIESSLEALGFDVRPVVTDFDSVVDLAFTTGEDGARSYDMYLLGWTLGNPALPGFYDQLFAADGASNSTGYADEGFQSALERYQSSVLAADAKQALWEMELILATDQPYLVLYHPEITEAYRSDRISFRLANALGGIQGRLGGLEDLIPVD